MKLANAIAKHLEFDSNWINDESKSARILTFYIPVALWLYQQVQIGKKVELCNLTGEYVSSLENAVCVGLSIPQGGGKTTISECLEVALLELGIKAGVVSYDDFYLTYEDQKKVAEKYSDNRFL
jgi:D-glycerate 3-kinase